MRIIRNFFALLLSVVVFAVGCDKAPDVGYTPEVMYDKEIVATTLAGSSYRGASGVGDSFNYLVVLSTEGVEEDGGLKANVDYYIFDIYSAQGGGSGLQTKIPNGDYLLDDESAMGDGSISAMFSSLLSTDGEPESRIIFGDARLVVRDNVIDAYITFATGETHHVHYDGTLAIPMKSPTSSTVMSTLAENHHFDIEDGVFVGAYVGDLLGVGCNTCQVYMWEYLDLETGEERGDIFQIDLQLPRGGKDICGAYTVGRGEGRFISGWAENIGGQYMQQNSWYMTADYTAYAPLVDGIVIVETDNNLDYTFFIEMVDDAGNMIRGRFRGYGEFTDW